MKGQTLSDMSPAPSMTRLSKTREIIGNIGAKSIFAALAAFLMTVAATFGGGLELYRNAKENILLKGESNATQAAKELDRYLLVRKNSVLLASHVIDSMIQRNLDSGEILEYLSDESKSIKASIDQNSTGLYGWILGTYLDGSGWVPDDDYIPTQRPWYAETMADDNAVTFVKPYLDKQTDTVMTTLGVRLGDNASVLAVDVSLGEIQEFTEIISRQTKGSHALVLDSNGLVIAHSDRSQLGKNYNEETDTLWACLADKLASHGQKHFELNYQGHRYMVYSETIEGDWQSISVINAGIFFKPLQIILALLMVLTLLEAVVFVTVFYRLSAKNLDISIQNVQIGTLADMYISIYDVNIDNDTMRAIRHKNADIEELQTASASLNKLLRLYTDEMSQPIMEPFIDLSTLPQRLQNTNTLTEEFLDNNRKWCRGRFLVAERNNENQVTRVLWLIESIDEEKKHRETLKNLSETDRMTGLYNRVAGEAKITELIKHGVGGMFIMLDVDKFKSINDTFGHDAGDKVIIAVARALSNAFRNSDIVVRLGGDEFIAYAPGVLNEEVGNRLLDRMFNNIGNETSKALEDRCAYVSVGAAFLPDNVIIPFADLYKKADICLYQSKKRQGNTVTFSQS